MRSSGSACDVMDVDEGDLDLGALRSRADLLLGDAGMREEPPVRGQHGSALVSMGQHGSARAAPLLGDAAGTREEPSAPHPDTDAVRARVCVFGGGVVVAMGTFTLVVRQAGGSARYGTPDRQAGGSVLASVRVGVVPCIALYV